MGYELRGKVILVTGATGFRRISFSYFARMLGKNRLPSVPGRLALGLAAVAERAARVFKSPPVLTRQEVLASMATATYDGAKARRDIGFEPGTNLAEGMRRVEDWLHTVSPPSFH